MLIKMESCIQKRYSPEAELEQHSPSKRANVSSTLTRAIMENDYCKKVTPSRSAQSCSSDSWQNTFGKVRFSMENDYCDECEGKPGGHQPHCPERFKSMNKEAKTAAKVVKKEAKRELSEPLILGSKETIKAFRSPGAGRGGVWTPEDNYTKRSTEAAESNARTRNWRLIVAIIIMVAVVVSIVLQVF